MGEDDGSRSLPQAIDLVKCLPQFSPLSWSLEEGYLDLKEF